VGVVVDDGRGEVAPCADGNVRSALGGGGRRGNGESGSPFRSCTSASFGTGAAASLASTDATTPSRTTTVNDLSLAEPTNLALVNTVMEEGGELVGRPMRVLLGVGIRRQSEESETRSDGGGQGAERERGEAISSLSLSFGTNTALSTMTAIRSVAKTPMQAKKEIKYCNSLSRPIVNNFSPSRYPRSVTSVA
jgi:hypothetical protein